MPKLIARFSREAKLMAKVRHPNVVSVLDFGVLPGGAPCLVMEYLQGESLETRLERCTRLAWREALAIVQQMLAGLAAAHAAHIVHRDIKPANVMLVPGQPEITKLIDFGIARSTQQDATRYTRTGMTIGTPAYMAPEQFLGQAIDARTDLYTVALVLYELLSGELPHGSTDMGNGDQTHHRRRAAAERAESAGRRARRVDRRGHGCARSRARAATGKRQRVRATPGHGRVGRASARGIGSGPTSAPAPNPAMSIATAGTELARPPAPAAREARYVIAARIPASRLRLADERRWLADLVSQSGRSFVLGAQHWFALQKAPAQESRSRAERTVAALRERYGSTTSVAVADIGDEFQLSSAALSGAEPLPAALTDLMAKL